MTISAEEIYNLLNQGQYEFIETQINQGIIDINSNGGLSALHLAVQAGNISIARWLIEHGANLSQLDEDENSALAYAFMSKTMSSNHDMIELLLGYGADIHQLSKAAQKKIHLIPLLRNHPAILHYNQNKSSYSKKSDSNEEALKKEGGIVDQAPSAPGGENNHSSDSTEPELPLIHATEVNTQEILELLEKLLQVNLNIDTRSSQGNNINIIDDNGLAAMHIAVASRNLEAMQILIDQNVDVNQPDAEGNSALHHAAASRNSEAMQMLLEHGANVNLPNQEGNTALHLAAIEGYLENILLLINNRANVTIPNQGGNTALHLAVLSGHERATQMLIGYNQNIGLRYNSEYVQAIQRLPGYSAYINFRNHEGNTALHLAVTLEETEIMSILINHGSADLTITNQEGNNALHHAVISGNINSMERLMTHNFLRSTPQAEREYRYLANGEGNTPLHLAVIFGNIGSVNMLLDNSVFPNIDDQDGNTPLHLAVTSGNLRIMRILIEYRANILLTNNEGNSVLHLAAASGNLAAMQLLLDPNTLRMIGQGVRIYINLSNQEGNSALDLATTSGNAEVIQLLIDHGARPSHTNQEGNRVFDQAVSMEDEVRQDQSSQEEEEEEEEEEENNKNPSPSDEDDHPKLKKHNDDDEDSDSDSSHKIIMPTSGKESIFISSSRTESNSGSSEPVKGSTTEVQSSLEISHAEIESIQSYTSMALISLAAVYVASTCVSSYIDSASGFSISDSLSGVLELMPPLGLIEIGG